MLLMIDNYDSFTYNLVQYFLELGEEVKVIRNDKLTLKDIEILAPERLVISPGPCTPKEAGISVAAIQEFAGKIPLLGICLGHQAITEAFGGKVVRADRLMHGKTSPIEHDGSEFYRGIADPFTATRYHSLIAERESFPATLKITAWTQEKEIMGLQHQEFPVWGVQFHPESILTTVGKDLLNNFLKITC
ncbi:aminodeoxychorismate/anthranilate synthase component II [uncultured Desulfuromusa sp.]|uniref:anthranilate synthase component II n=1 Tax=uncultured Desulfuromusa sp. TaxID=219183 RepID=UPI002AA7EE46|nr:aminodeoxychorismate/anthranilate synthase component II [uncultured Desulfuromusa sp.]